MLRPRSKEPEAARKLANKVCSRLGDRLDLSTNSIRASTASAGEGGAGACQVQIPPPFKTATSVAASAEAATDVRKLGGTLVTDVQFVPESAEVKTKPCPAATNLVPSEEQAMEFQCKIGDAL